ncbi:hypothetical protein ACTJIV_02695 [Chryseobacterium sp. 22532]
MKKNTNVPKACRVYRYTKDPEAFKRNNTELAALRTGTFIFLIK